MISNQMKQVLRSLMRHRTYTFLNLAGLTSGLIVFLLITLYVGYEFSYDDYHEKKDRIYRVFKRNIGRSYQGSDRFAVIPAPLPAAMKADFPEVVESAIIDMEWNTVIRANNEVYFESAVYTADPSIFNIFSLPLVSGAPDQVLAGPKDAALSHAYALKYFGRLDVVGEVIRLRDEIDFRISGVFEDMPSNSHFVMDVIFNFQGLMAEDNVRTDRWDNSSFYCFVLLDDPEDRAAVQAKLPELRAKYADDPIDEDGQESNYYLQSMNHLHFTSDINFDVGPSADARRLYAYLGIAFMILFIAATNYVNLATARAVSRTREIGIRKAMGAHRLALMLSFLRESALLVGMAMFLSLIVVSSIRPFFSDFVGKGIPLPVDSVQFWLAYLSLGGATTLLSGIYPALVLSRFKVVPALKGKRSSGGNLMTRNALVVFQFTISCTLILGASVVNNQLHYIQNMDTGFAKDQIIVLRARDAKVTEKLKVFKDELRKVPGVVGVSSSSSLPNNISAKNSANWPGKPEDVDIPLYTVVVDYDYVDLYELELVEGRRLSRELDRSGKGMLLNESAVQALGWEEPLGRKMMTWFRDTATVVGVVKDFHQHSVHLPIAACQFFLQEDRRTISIKVEGEDMDAALRGIENVYSSFDPVYPFDYKFFNDIFDRAYRSEMKTARLAGWFTALAILIACLGLYGLAAHQIQSRIKEVGVRKVLGASVPRILALLTKDFGVLLLLSFAIASPIAWYFMRGWLNDFAYHIDLTPGSFLMALGLMLLVAGLTIGYRTYAAASRNPVEALREE